MSKRTRYIAEWVRKQIDPNDGAAVEYDSDSSLETLDDAKSKAIFRANLYAVADWCAVEIQTRAKRDYCWTTVERWVGDTDGNWNQII